MGLYSRYAAALLILCLVPAIVQGAVRQKLKPPAKQIVTESTAGVSMPNGARHYYGNERYYSLDYSLNASSSTKIPTVRPVQPSTIGKPSFPYGGTPFYPDTPNQVLKVKPKAVVPTAGVIPKFKNLLKATPQQFVFAAGSAAAMAAVGWAFDELAGQVTKQQTVLADPGQHGWKNGSVSALTPIFATPVESCLHALQSTTYGCQAGACEFSHYELGTGVDKKTCIGYRRFKSTGLVNSYKTDSVHRVGTCSSPDIFDPDAGTCSKPDGQPVPVTAAEIDATDFSQIDQEWLDDILKDSCNGSPSPDACFEELRSQSPIEGPAVVQGPSSTTSQTKILPDGSTETTTTTTKTEHPITYGDGYFDVGTRTTTTSEVNGIPTGTTVTEDTSIPEPIAPDAPPQNDQPEPEYTFEDSEFPAIEPFYEPKYPDGLSSVWSDAYVTVGQTAFISFLNGFVPNFSGSCPSFGMSFAIASWANYGSIDFMNLCYVLEFVKMIFLVTAMFTSRQIIFGG